MKNVRQHRVFYVIKRDIEKFSFQDGGIKGNWPVVENRFTDTAC